MEPSLEPKHENPLLEQSNEIHETCYDTSEAQPRERERETDRQTDRERQRERQRERETERETEKERERERERERCTHYMLSQIYTIHNSISP